MSKDMQLELKRESVERSLRRNGGFDYDVPPVISLNEWGYRNKLSLPFGINGLGDVVVGFYEKRTHKVVSMKHCALHGEWASELIEIVTKWANENKLSVYNEHTGVGLLRHLVARKLDNLSVTLVIRRLYPEFKFSCTRNNKGFDIVDAVDSCNVFEYIRMSSQLFSQFSLEIFQRISKHSP